MVGIAEAGVAAEAETEVIGLGVAAKIEGGDLVPAVGVAVVVATLVRDAKKTCQNLKKIVCTKAW